jgi:glycosyltransferase involved in cell wall biosynthesis
MKVSVALSIHNRSNLFGRALRGYLNQTMNRKDWEVILVDDMSTEDLRSVYSPFIGKINLMHVKMDHTRHPVFREMNPGWKPGQNKTWYHTPAISTNIAVSLSSGSVICLCHPEILHAPSNFQLAYEHLSSLNNFLFGKTYLGTLTHNQWLDMNDWHSGSWTRFLQEANKASPLEAFPNNALYWYTSFLPKVAVSAVGGVDFKYLHGVAGEDDDFKERIKKAGWPPLYFESIQGFHQDHSDEKEAHHRRDTEAWHKGLKTNRELLRNRMQVTGFPKISNEGYDWTGSECVVSSQTYNV